MDKPEAILATCFGIFCLEGTTLRIQKNIGCFFSTCDVSQLIFVLICSRNVFPRKNGIFPVEYLLEVLADVDGYPEQVLFRALMSDIYIY